MIFKYTPTGVCSRQMIIDIDEETDVIKSVEIIGGCPGNGIGIAKLVQGKKVDEVITILKGVECGYKGTSCPDQLAIALEEYKKKK